MYHSVEPSRPNRVKVGEQRKLKTRLKLLEAALFVLHNKGIDNVFIEDIVVAAGVSRGTFYNYFTSNQEFILTLASELNNEILDTVDALVLEYMNPLERFSRKTRLYLRFAARYPLWGAFLHNANTRFSTRGPLIERYPTPDLSAATETGLIKVDNPFVTRDLVLGSVFQGIETMMTNQTANEYPEYLIMSILRSLHVPEDQLETYALNQILIPMPDHLKSPITSLMAHAKK